MMRKDEKKPTFRAVIFYKRELEQKGEAELYYPKDVIHLCSELQQHGIKVIAEEQTAGEITLTEILRREDLEPTEVLVLAATDKVLRMARRADAATIAYANPDYPKEERMASSLLVEDFTDMDETEVLRVWQRYHHLPWTILETKRCVVRELELADLDALFALYEQPHMTDYMEPLYDREQEIRYQRAYIENMYAFYGYGMWLVIEKSSRKVIGRAGLENRTLYGGAELELGYAIATDHQNQGYATEVCEAILQYAAEHLGEYRIHCLIEPENVCSVHLAKKLGFTCAHTITDQGKKYLDYTREMHNP